MVTIQNEIGGRSGVPKIYRGVIETIILLPVIVLLIVSIFILTVLGSFGRTYVIVKDGVRRTKLGKSEGVPVEVVGVERPELYKVAGLEVPKPTSGNLN